MLMQLCRFFVFFDISSADEPCSNLTCIMISIVDLIHYGVSHAIYFGIWGL